MLRWLLIEIDDVSEIFQFNQIAHIPGNSVCDSVIRESGKESELTRATLNDHATSDYEGRSRDFT